MNLKQFPVYLALNKLENALKLLVVKVIGMIDCIDWWFRPLLIYVQEEKGAYSWRDMPLREWPLRELALSRKITA